MHSVESFQQNYDQLDQLLPVLGLSSVTLPLPLSILHQKVWCSAIERLPPATQRLHGGYRPAGAHQRLQGGLGA